MDESSSCHKPASAKRLVIHFDGASKGNPGPAAIGIIIHDERGGVQAIISSAIGIATNNQAEYKAAISALGKAAALGAKEVELYSDSELLVKQINGQYRVKQPGLKPLFDRVKQLLGSFEAYSVNYVPRELNMDADRIANRALKSR